MRTESADGTASSPRPRSASCAAVRTHQSSSARRRAIVGAASTPTTSPIARAACTRTNQLGILEAGEQGGADLRACPGRERLGRGRAHVGVGVPRHGDELVPRKLGIWPEEGRRPEPHDGVPAAEERDQLGAWSRGEALDLGGDARARPVPALQCADEPVDRPLVAEVAEHADRGAREGRIRVLDKGPNESWRRGVAGLRKPCDSGDASPLPSSVRGRPPARRMRRVTSRARGSMRARVARRRS